jgi:hypothetical protein
MYWCFLIIGSVAGTFLAAAEPLHPVLRQYKVVYVMRQQYAMDHHNTGTDFALGELSEKNVRLGAAIRMVDFASGGKTATLLDQPQGLIRDLEVSYDGTRLLFSMRRTRDENFHIFEMDADGSGLKQLTSRADAADMDPAYLPDGRIVFSSTRDPKYCGCNRYLQANLFAMNADGTNIRQLGHNTLYESRPSVLPDGRIIYDRWEYVDRHYGSSFGLWTMMPDGRTPTLYYGNNAWSPGAIFDARALPRADGGFYADRVVCTFGACHNRPWGAIVILDRRLGLDGMKPLLRTWPKDLSPYLTFAVDYGDGRALQHPMERYIDAFGPQWSPGSGVPLKYEDPYPLDETHILCARMVGPESERTGIFLLNAESGGETLLHTDGSGCFDPMPLMPRWRPPVLPEQVDLSRKTGTFYVTDVYKGTGMERVPRGSVKTLRIVEAPAKRFWTSPAWLSAWLSDTTHFPAVNYNCTSVKRILGEVPVEADGSASFEMPAERFVFFQALDADGMMVQSMRSGTSLQPGEHAGCTGCHESRYDSQPPLTGALPLALRRTPSQLKSWHGPERDFNYLAEVQPVFDAHCVKCHDYGKEGAKALNLCGDLGMVFNVSYVEIRRRSVLRWYPDKPGQKKELVKPVDDGPPEVLPPYAWGACRSRLVDVIRGGHHGVKLPQEAMDRIVAWIDLNTSYYGSYASNFPDNPYGRCPLTFAQTDRLSEITGAGPSVQSSGGPLKVGAAAATGIDFTRPEFSPCLSGFKDTNDVKFVEALALIREGRRVLYETTRADMPNFVLRNPVDLAREQREKRVCAMAEQTKNEITEGQRVKDR